WTGRVVSISWGPWAEIGMASPELQERFAERGVQPISPKLGQRMFAMELERGIKGDAEVILGAGPWCRRTGQTSVPDQLPLIDNQCCAPCPGGALEIARVLDPACDLYLED